MVVCACAKHEALLLLVVLVMVNVKWVLMSCVLQWVRMSQLNVMVMLFLVLLLRPLLVQLVAQLLVLLALLVQLRHVLLRQVLLLLRPPCAASPCWGGWRP